MGICEWSGGPLVVLRLKKMVFIMRLAAAASSLDALRRRRERAVAVDVPATF